MVRLCACDVVQLAASDGCKSPSSLKRPRRGLDLVMTLKEQGDTQSRFESILFKVSSLLT